jgi:predicted transcriptional regulator
MSSVSMIFRLPDELKYAFDRICAAGDRTASQILRDLIRSYVRDHSQSDLLPPPWGGTREKN